MLAARLLALIFVALSLGCAPAASPGDGGDRRSQVITIQEINAAGMSGSAYELISRLRPSFLVSRGQTTLGGDQSVAYPNVYVDDVAFGDISTLRHIDVAQIAQIRMYQSWEAQTKFGLGNSGGVIAIVTRR
jgi:hypothetical protein